MSGISHDYTVRVHQEDDSYWATVDSLPGCFAAGDTLDELRASLADSISAYLSTEDHRVEVRILETDRIEVSETVTYVMA